MFRVSNFVVGFVNFCFMILGLVATCFSLYLYFHGGSQCQKFIQNPLLITGVFLFVVSLLGLIGSWCKSNFVMLIYLVVMFFVIVGLIILTVFVFFITNEGAGKVVSGKGFKEYKVMDFSNWMQNHFVNGKKNWEGIKNCLIDAKVCSNDVSQTASDFYKKNLSPMQSGCCKPPSECGFEFKNATWWVAPKTGPATEDSDCTTWSNVQSELCYECNSCKGGFLANIRKEWRHLAIINICLCILIIVIYSFGCCARRNNERDARKYHPV